MSLKRYENEEYNVDELQSIDELVYFEAEDFNILELINDTTEEFRVKEIQERKVDEVVTTKKDSSDTSFTKKINQLKTSLNSISSTAVTTSIVAVTAAIGVGTIMPELIVDDKQVIDYGEIEFLNYTLDYDHTTKLTLFFKEELAEGVYCIVINKETNEELEVSNGSVTFENLNTNEHTFEVNILDDENVVLSNETITLDLSNNPYLGEGEFTYSITYNEDNTSNLFILLEETEYFNSSELFLTVNDEKLSYVPIYNDDLIIFENIKEEKFILEGKSYYKDINTHTIFNYSKDFNLDQGITFDIYSEFDELTLSTPLQIEGDLKLTIEYLDTSEREEFLIPSSEVNGQTLQVNLSRVVDEYLLTIEGSFYVSEQNANINTNKGHYYRKYTYSEIVNPTVYTYANLDRVDILNDSYSTWYTDELYGVPTNLYFEGYLTDSASLTVNVYNQDKTVLIDSIENIKSLEETISFYDLDTTEELVFEYIVYENGEVIITEEYIVLLSLPSDYSNLDYNANNPNPNDVFKTYNEDGTYNAYFNMGFSNNTLYDIEYTVELTVYTEIGEETLYKYQGADSVAVIYNISPENSYGLSYSLFLKDGINYYAISDKVVPSGTVESYIVNDVYEASTYFEETEEIGIYMTTLSIVPVSDVEIEIVLDTEEVINVIIPYDEITFEYSNSGYASSAIIQLDLSSYEFNNAEVKITTYGNPYYGLGDQIKESGIEIIGKEFSKVIYETTISK